MQTSTQERMILDYLLVGGTLTSLEAMQKFKCMRLASRISDLKSKGYPIRSQMIETDSGKHVKEYWITPEDAKDVAEKF